MTNPRRKFDQALATRQLPDPFAGELRALRAIPPLRRMQVESVRLQKLEAFDQARKSLNPSYHAALSRANWPKVAAIAGKLLTAAQAILALSLLLAFLTSPAAAQQSLPQGITDPAINENLLYLDQKIRSLDEEADTGLTLAEIEASSPVFHGVITVSSIAYSASRSSEGVVSLLNGVYDRTAMGPCFSTVSITVLAGQWVEVYFNGSFGQVGAAGSQGVGYLRNGAFVNGHSSTNGNAIAVNSYMGGDWREYDYPGAGTHSYCITGATTAGYLIIPQTGAGFITTAHFGVNILP